MGVASPERLTGPQIRTEGAYLTDGRRLYRVVDCKDSEVALENCMAPDERPFWMRVAGLVNDPSWRRVVPE